MSTSQVTRIPRSMHGLGIACGLAAGVWLGGAEAPTKLVSVGFSPLSISLAMVFGVFVARWTLPTLFKGTDYVFRDLAKRPHLIVWAALAGALWAVANTLTIYAIGDVGLAIAFPLWNTNCLVGLFWGWLLFHELKGAGFKSWVKVLGGAIAIVCSAVVLSSVSTQTGMISSARASSGVMAALGAGLLWGTMYVPYRKAYLSGMNPLSFVTVFTFGELGTMGILAATFRGGNLISDLGRMHGSIFWLFLGGFCWVIGDLFQQYATKYIGISRAIPLSNTNQLWGLAWGVLVFGEFAHARPGVRLEVVAGSLVMIAGAAAIASAAQHAGERASSVRAMARECNRYRLNLDEALDSLEGSETIPKTMENGRGRRPWWDYAILAVAVGIFAWLASRAGKPPIPMNGLYTIILSVILVAVFLGCGWFLWKRTRFV